MRDILDVKSRDVLVEMVDDIRTNIPDEVRYVDEFDDSMLRTKNDKKWKFIDGEGGGSTHDFPKRVKLSDKLLLYADEKNGRNSEGSDARTNHTLGGIFLHEFIYHLHPLGKSENGNPNKMRVHYRIFTNNNDLSTKHGAGPNTGRMIDLPKP